MAVVKTKIVFDVTPEFRERWLRLCEREHLTQVELFRRLVAEREGSEMTSSETLSTNAEECRKSLAPLYTRYDRQTQPQPAYIELDPGPRTLTADYSGEIGNAVPEGVYHGRRFRLNVNPYVKGATIADLLEDQRTQSLARRIFDGYEEKWDGNNYLGHLNEDASDAYAELERYVEESIDPETDCVSVYEPGDWVDSAGDAGIAADTPDDRLAELANEIVGNAANEGVIVEGDMLAHLTGLRDALR